MVRILSVTLLSVLALVSCKSDQATGNDRYVPDTTATDNTVAATTQADTARDLTYTDSFALKMDSLEKVNVSLPPVYYKDIFSANADANEKFNTLSKATNGNMKILVNSKLLTNEIVNTIDSESTDYADLMFLIDKTYSMKDDIDNVKQGLNKIIEAIKRHKRVRLAIAAYGDKNTDSSWFTFKNFERNYDAAERYLDSIQVQGGGDIPESVYDAFFRCYDKSFWMSRKRRTMILVGDAPPLEKPLSDYTMADVIKKAKEGAVMMNFYPIIVIPAVDSVKLPPEEISKYHEGKISATLSPNPTSDYINVGFEFSDRYFIELYDMAGKLHHSESFFGVFWNRSIGNLPDGMYILRITNANKEYESFKFVVHK